MTRRDVIKGGGLLGLLFFSNPLAFATSFLQEEFKRGFRYLDLYAVNTGERERIAYWIDGEYLKDALDRINYLLRDYRSGDVASIDPNLLDLVYITTRLCEKDKVLVISGYRSFVTNYIMHQRKKGVAEHSYHTKGKAVDIRIEGVPLKTLRDVAVALRAGGVGYYPKSGFVHMDTGPVRHW